MKTFLKQSISILLCIAIIFTSVQGMSFVASSATVDDKVPVMHFLIRHWHSVPEGGKYDEDFDQTKEENTFLIEGYIAKIKDDSDSNYHFYLSTAEGSGFSDLEGSENEYKEVKSENISDFKGYISSVNPTDGSITFAVNPRKGEEDKALESFSGFSVSAGHDAIKTNEASTEGLNQLTITYREDVHLVKSHVFYRNDSIIVNGTSDSAVFGDSTKGENYNPEKDTDEVYVFTQEINCKEGGGTGTGTDKKVYAGDVVKGEDGKPVKNAEDLSSLKDEYETELKEGTNVAKVKVYNTLAGLHTDKTAHTYPKIKDEDAMNERMFQVDLEAWFSGNNIADVGLILDASGSMAFTAESLDRIKVDLDNLSKAGHDLTKKQLTEEHLNAWRESITDNDNQIWEQDIFLTDEELTYILDTNNTDNSRLSYSGYTYYIYDARSSVKEYVPLGYWGGEYEISKALSADLNGLVGFYPFKKGSGSGTTRDWLLNALTEDSEEKEYAQPVEEQDKDTNGGITFEVPEDFSKDELVWPNVPFKMNESNGYVFGQDGQNEKGENSEGGLLLDAIPNTGNFTISFKLKMFGTIANRPGDEAEILYIGPSDVKPGDEYFRLFRGSNGSGARLKGAKMTCKAEGSDEKNEGKDLISLNKVFGDKTTLTVTLVFDNGDLTAYCDGVKCTSSSAKPDSGEHYPINLPNNSIIVLNGLADTYNDSQIAIDDVYIFDNALSSNEVKKLYDTHQNEEDEKVSDFYVDVYDGTAPSKDGGADEEEIIGSLNSAFVGDAKNQEDAEEIKKRAGWYYVNSNSNWSTNYFNEDLQSGKELHGLHGTGKNKTTFNNQDVSIPPEHKDDKGWEDGEIDKTELTYTNEKDQTNKFYIDADGYLRCLYSTADTKSGNEERWGISFVYQNEDEGNVKVEALQRALGSFVTNLNQSSPDSRVSAVRFSTDKIPDGEYDKLVLLDWTSDTEESAGILSLTRGDGGTMKGDESADGLMQYNYGLTGGTNTGSGLRAFRDILDKRLDEDTDRKGTNKYLIIFTDGKDTVYNENNKDKDGNDSNESVVIANELKDKGYTIFTVMLAGGTVAEGSPDYTGAKEFLKKLAGTGKEGENVEDYIFEASTVDELTKAFTNEIIAKISDNLDNYTVKDTIDPRFDLVASNGDVWHLYEEGNVLITGSSGDKWINVKTTEEGKNDNIITIAPNSDFVAQRPALKFDDTNKLYYLEWSGQTIPGCATGTKRLSVWNATITLKAKDDFIGGNAVLTNGNTANQNYVYYSGTDDDKSSGTSDMERVLEGTEGATADLHPSKGFPRTVVNVPLLELEDGKSEQLIYMGEDLTPKETAKKLVTALVNQTALKAGKETTAEKIGATSKWYWEYLERYVYAFNDSYNSLEDLLAAVIEASKETEPKEKYIEIDYSYLSNDKNTLFKTDVKKDSTEIHNQPGTEAHKIDVLGSIKLEWKEVAEGGNAFPDNGTTKDKKTRISTLTLTYTPDKVTDREFDVHKLIDETVTPSGAASIAAASDGDIYDWDEEYKPIAGDEVTDTPKSIGTYTTNIISGEILVRVKLNGKELKFLRDNGLLDKGNEGEDGGYINYSVDLYRTYEEGGIKDAVKVAEYKLHYKVPTDETIQDQVVYATVTFTDEYKKYVTEEKDRLPIGTYTFKNGKGTETYNFTDVKAITVADADLTNYTIEDNKNLTYAADISSDYTSIMLGVPAARKLYTDLRLGLGEVEGSIDGVFELTKEVENTTVEDKDREYTFKFTFENSSSKAETEYTYYKYEIDTATGELETKPVSGTIKNGDTITLKAKEKIIIIGLPKGSTVKVEETPVDNFTTTVEGLNGTEVKDGKVTITENYSENGKYYGLAFTNTRKNGKLSVSKELKADENTQVVEGVDSKSEFEYTLKLTDHDNNPFTQDTEVDYTKGEGDSGKLKVGADGTITFKLKKGEKITFTLVTGTKYELTEKTYDGYDTKPENASGTIDDENEITATFTNTKKTPKPVSVQLSGEKTLKSTGKKLAENLFSFTLTSSGSNGANDPLTKEETVTNGADGTFKFNELKFTAAGTYTYTVKEQSGSEPGYSYSGDTYTVTVTVTEKYDGDLYTGELDAKVEVKKGETVVTTKTGSSTDKQPIEISGLDFVNEYTVSPITISLSGKKTLKSGSRTLVIPENYFSFTIKGRNGDEPLPKVATVSNDAAGAFTFKDITFVTEGEYYYTITENSKTGDGVTYDTTTYYAKVDVTEVPDEVTKKVALSAKVSYNTTSFEAAFTETGTDKFDFTNTVQDGKLTVSKTVDKGNKEREFSFTVKFTYDGKPLNSVLVGTEEKTLTGGVYTFNLKNGEEVTFTGIPFGTEYTVTEDNTGYTTQINGSPDEDAVITGKIENTAEFTLAFKNTVKPVKVTPTAKKSYDPTEENFKLKADMFSFTLTRDPENGDNDPLKVVTALILVAKNDADGNVTFNELSFTNAGTYKYTITEANDHNHAINYSTEKYTFVVEVKEADDGTLSITSHYEKEVGTTVSAAEFTNTLKRGDLTVSKTVADVAGADKTKKFGFTVTLDDKTINGTYGEMTFKDGVAEFELADGESLKAEELPYGIGYTVTEKDDDEYTTESTGATGTISDVTERKAAFTNTRKTGDLSVSKIVTGSGAHTKEQFEFTVTLDDTSINGTFGGMTFTNGVAKFTLKHGDTVTATGLPAGTGYTVEEEDVSSEGYATTHTGEEGTISSDGTKSEVVFENHREAGSIRIHKNVVGKGASSTKTFGFKITITDPENSDKHLEVDGKYGDVEFTDGVGYFNLKDDQTITVSDIPKGLKYKVEETESDMDGYILTKVEKAEGTVGEGSIAVEFTNTFKTGSLTVKKTVTGNGGDKTKLFHFVVTLSDTSINGKYGGMTFKDGKATFTLKNGGSITATDLPEGISYGVQETEANLGGYTTTSENASGTITYNSASTASFTNDRKVGSITVSKVIDGNGADPNREFHFLVQLSDTSINGTYGGMSFTNGKAEFTLKGGESAKAEGLPTGATFTVTETEANKGGYSTKKEITESITKDNILSEGETVEVKFTNERHIGSLTVAKVVEGTGGDADKDFHFTVTLDNKTINGTYGDMTFTNGVAEFTLKHYEYKRAIGLPAGVKFTITEDDADKDGYKTEQEIHGDDDNNSILSESESIVYIFTNTREISSLTVSKVIDGSGADKDKEFNFTITLSDTTISGKYGDMTFNNGVATFTLKGGEKLTATELPAGVTYEVTETEANKDGYTTTATNASGKLEDGQSYTAEFKNARYVGNLTVEKSVTGTGGDKSKAFNFTVTLSDAGINGTFGDMTFTNGVATFTLKDGESLTATGLPADIRYTVTETEADKDGYKTTATAAAGTIADGKTAEVLFINNKELPPPPSTGNLTVSKTVTGDNGDTTKAFNFTVTLDDTTINGTYGDMTFTNGVAEFTLKHGESKTAVGLPADVGYEVAETEANADGYKTTAFNAKGTISDGETADVSFTNEKNKPVDPTTGNIKVSKVVEGIGDKEADFHFTVTLSDTSINGTYGDMFFVDGVAEFTLKDGKFKLATGLPAGVGYTVVETEENKDGYITTSSGSEGTITEGETAEVTFTNNKPKPAAGSLTVSKTVTGAGDKTKAFNFTVTLSDKTINGAYGQMMFTNGVATFTLKDGESLTAEGLPANITYEVTEAEANADGYTTTATGDEGTITKDETAKAEFTNEKQPEPPTPETGNLTVSKTVTGAGDKQKAFTFTITLSDTSVNGTFGNITFTNGIAIFTLKHGESKTATGLPANVSYEIVESDNDGYIVTATNDKGEIKVNETIKADFENEKPDGSPETGHSTNIPACLTLMAASAVVIKVGLDEDKKKKRHQTK